MAPAAKEFISAGDAAFGLAVSPNGATIVTSSSGLYSQSLAVAERTRAGNWQARQFNLDHGRPISPVYMGLAFDSEKSVYASDGPTGNVIHFEWSSDRRRAISLNQGRYTASSADDLALDPASGALFAADRANSRVAVIDTRSRQVVASLPIDRPGAMVVASGTRRVFVITQAAPGMPGFVHAVNVMVPSQPKIDASIPLDRPFGIAASGTHVFVSDSLNDAITVIDIASGRVQATIPLRIPGLEDLHGIQPMGLAWHEASGWLLAAEAGINAIGVIDVGNRRVLGHIPTAWYPSRVAVHQDTVFAANSYRKTANVYDGIVSVIPLPGAAELAEQTGVVMDANGFRQRPADPRPLPEGVHHVVMIVKGNRSYDEFMGDVERASNGPAMGNPAAARFGASGLADGRGIRLSIKNANIAPNHRTMSQLWSFADNFYATGFPEADALRRHLERHGASFAEFGDDAGTAKSDQARAAAFVREVESKYLQTGAALPRLVVVHLPNDRMAPMRPAEGYPYEESFVADNDYALGRILEFLSGTPWWKEMAVFVTEAEGFGGPDHIDAQRTALYCGGPWARKNYVTHVNTSFPGLFKTAFRLLKVPPMDLSDVAATDLAECFTPRPDFAPYKAKTVDPRLFDPAAVLEKQ